MKKHGLTLLELLAVLFVAAVLAATALPQFFKMVELSRGREALATLGAIRRAVERCFSMTGGVSYRNCNEFDKLAFEDPNDSSHAHFDYGILTPGNDDFTFVVVARRNSLNGGDSTSTISIKQEGDVIERRGTGVFANIE